MLRKRILWGSAGLSAALLVFALLQFFALRQQGQTIERLRTQLMEEVREHGRDVEKALELQAAADRDYAYRLEQAIKLEGVRIRDDLKERCNQR